MLEVENQSHHLSFCLSGSELSMWLRRSESSLMIQRKLTLNIYIDKGIWKEAIRSSSYTLWLAIRSQGCTPSCTISGAVYSVITTHEVELLQQQKLRMTRYRCPRDWSSELWCGRYRCYTWRCSSHSLLDKRYRTLSSTDCLLWAEAYISITI